MFNEILKPGEKVKRIRKILGVTQSKLGGTLVTRFMISQIETGRVKLAPYTATKLSKRINEIADKKKINLIIDSSFLLESTEMQAIRILENNLRELRILKMSDKHLEFNDKIIEVEKKLEKIDLYDKFKLYELAADFYFEKYDFEEAEVCLLKCFKMAARNRDEKVIIELIEKLIRIYGYMGKYKAVISLVSYVNKLISKQNVMEVDIIKNTYFNQALALKKLGENDKCIELLNKIRMNFIIDKKKVLDMDMLEANCYMKLQDYKKVEQIYLRTLNKAIDTDYNLIVALSYANLAELYFKMKNINLAEDYIERAVGIKDIGNDDIIAQIYYGKFKIYASKAKNIEAVRESFKDTIHKLNISKNKDLLTKVINEMCDYCIQERSYNDVLKILELIDEKIKNNDFINEKIPCIFYKAYVYLKENQNESADKVLYKGLKLLKVSGF